MTLETISIISLCTGAGCCILLIIDLIGRPQPMGIMDLVWPLTALYSGPLGLYAYYTIGRAPRKKLEQQPASSPGSGPESPQMPPHRPKPFWQSILTGTLHCGSGCTLGDIFAEFFLARVAIRLFASKLLTNWTVEYIFAFVIGIIFQYFAIRPMKKDLSGTQALIAALKSDALSLTFWQLGMYGWMAVATFLLFHHALSSADPLFWWMMQLGMLAGFLTAWPINRWLLKQGIKEAM
jgi:hypothetical protein